MKRWKYGLIAVAVVLAVVQGACINGGSPPPPPPDETPTPPPTAPTPTPVSVESVGENGDEIRWFQNPDGLPLKEFAIISLGVALAEPTPVGEGIVALVSIATASYLALESLEDFLAHVPDASNYSTVTTVWGANGIRSWAQAQANTDAATGEGANTSEASRPGGPRTRIVLIQNNPYFGNSVVDMLPYYFPAGATISVKWYKWCSDARKDRGFIDFQVFIIGTDTGQITPEECAARILMDFQSREINPPLVISLHQELPVADAWIPEGFTLEELAVLIQTF